MTASMPATKPARKRQRGHRGQGSVYKRAGRPGYFGTIDEPTEDSKQKW